MSKMLGALGTGIVLASIGASFGALYLLCTCITSGRDLEQAGSWGMSRPLPYSVPPTEEHYSSSTRRPGSHLEAVAFTSLSFMGPFFLAFGLDYTGRGNLIRTPLFGIVAIVPLLAVIVVATNPAHQLVWTDFQIAPVFGLATAEYTVQPLGCLFLLFSIGTAAVGSLLLIGAVLSYGPLYRHEAIAVVLSTVPPTVGVSVWLLELGPVPQLHLTAPLMLIHVSLDAYAFVGTHMFETNPATQRMAEQTGLDSLSDPVFILDTEQQIVRVNDRAEALFSSTLSNTLPISLNTVLGVELETLREDGEIRLEMERDRTFAVSYTGLSDPSGTSVGEYAPVVRCDRRSTA